MMRNNMICILPRQDSVFMTASLTVLFHPNLVCSARKRHDHGRRRPKRKLEAVKPLVYITNLYYIHLFQLRLLP